MRGAFLRRPPMEPIQKIQEIFRDIIGRADITLKPTDTPADIDGWDSVAHINILAAIQDEFGIELTLDEISGFANAGDIIAAITAKTQK